MDATELSHQFKHMVAQQLQGATRSTVFGHIASYDPALNRVKVIIPSLRDENDNPVVSGWMPLNTMLAGNGYGIQVAPVGGATAQNPTGGELVAVSIMNGQYGLSAVAGMIFNQVNAPPVPDLAPGEIAIVGKGGSFLRFYTDKHIGITSKDKLQLVTDGTGDIDITSGGKVAITSTGDCTVSSQGNLTLMAAGSLVIQAVASMITGGGAALKLVTSAFEAFFNTHTHPSNGQPPTQQMTSAQLTSTFEAQ